MVSRSTVRESSSTATLSTYRITRPSTATAGAAADTRVSLGSPVRGQDVGLVAAHADGEQLVAGQAPEGATVARRRTARRVSTRLTPPSARAGSQARAAFSATAPIAAVQGTPCATRATTRAASRGLAP